MSGRISLRSSIGALLLASIALAGCGEPISDEYVVHDPSTLTEIENEAGIEVVQVGLTESAAERLGIETVPIERDGARMRVPLSAVLLDPDGEWWVYTVPEPLTYVREPIEIATERGQTVFIDDGPRPGTAVVTVGVPELYGAETGMDH